MGTWQELPARDRPGKLAWLGPISLCAGLLSWITPGGGVAVALGAMACGVLSVRTRGPYQVDKVAVAGIGVGSVHVGFTLVLLVMAVSGY